MEDKGKIKNFVQDTLGCGCPEEVFDHIESGSRINLTDEIFLKNKLNIGNRLLIYIIEVSDPAFIEARLGSIVQRGKSERDENNFNRFRLVVVTDNKEVNETANNTFNYLDDLDEKIHLHIIDHEGYRQMIE